MNALDLMIIADSDGSTRTVVCKHIAICTVERKLGNGTVVPQEVIDRLSMQLPTQNDVDWVFGRLPIAQQFF